MTGSTLAPIVIPIVVAIGLAAWLAMIYYAAAHPQWNHARDRGLSVAQPDARPAGTAGSAPGPDRASKREIPHAA